jgi:hypothetical protein
VSGRALLRLAPLALTVFMQATWVENLLLSPDPRARVRQDWYPFYETGQRLLAGQLDAIYPHAFDRGYLWLYPPFCIYLTAPLGVLPEWWAYALCVAVEIAAVAGALALLRVTLPAPSAAHATAAIVVLASMPFNTTLAIGQVSGVLALVLAAGLWAWRRGRPLAAGLLLALFFAKPNLAVFFLGACLLARAWRVLAGIAAGCALLVLASLPLGVERWHEYLYTTRHYLEVVPSVAPMWKQLTLYAFWRTVASGPGTALGPWLASVAGLVALAALAWWRRRGEPAALPRLFGLTVLLALGANLYVYFYDGLLLLVPGVVWWVERHGYRSRWRHGLIGACLLGVFVDGYVKMVLVGEGIGWTGALIALWLACEALDLLATPAPIRQAG